MRDVDVVVSFNATVVGTAITVVVLVNGVGDAVVGVVLVVVVDVIVVCGCSA